MDKERFTTYLQKYNYDCGAGAAALVLLNFGISKVDHQWLMSKLEVRRNGTWPNKLEDFFKRRREFDVLSKEQATIEDLRHELREDRLVIVLYQGSGTRQEISNLKSGHYSVVAGIGTKYVYLLDPGVDEDSGEGIGWHKISITDFQRRWRDKWKEKGQDVYSLRWMLSVGLKKGW